MKTTYTAGVDLFLVDGEIHAIDLEKRILGYYTNVVEPIFKHNGIQIKSNCFPIIHSTKEIEGVHLLDRNSFVKGEDLDDLAQRLMPNVFNRNQAVQVFKAGYRANKNEFTRDDIAVSIAFGINLVKYGKEITEDILNMEYEGFLHELRPLSLPSSVTIENNEIIEVKWN